MRIQLDPSEVKYIASLGLVQNGDVEYAALAGRTFTYRTYAMSDFVHADPTYQVPMQNPAIEGGQVFMGSCNADQVVAASATGTNQLSFRPMPPAIPPPSPPP